MAGLGLLGWMAVCHADCAPDPAALCLQAARFAVTVSWQTPDGRRGAATPLALTPDAGLFWFFAPSNIEMLVKVLDGCAIDSRYWVFAAAATNVAYTLRVTDSVTGQVRSYENPQGIASPALTDTAAFATCGAAGPLGQLALGAFAVDPVGADRRTLDAARGLGVGLVRATPNLSWYGNQPSRGGPYSWQANPAGNLPDLYQRQLQAYGLRTYRILASTRPDDPGKPPQATDPRAMFLLSPDLRDDWQGFVRAVVERYDGDGVDDMPGLTTPVKAWSYTPEAGANFVPAGDAAGFVTMFNLTADAVHQADPSAQVILPLATKGHYVAAFVAGFLPRSTISLDGKTYTRAQAQTAFASNVAYTQALIDGTTPDVYDLHLYGDAESVSGRKAWLEDYLRRHGKPLRPIVAMEGGEPFAELDETFPPGPASCPPSGHVAEDAARLGFQSAALLRQLGLSLVAGFAATTFNLGPEYASFGSTFGDLDLWDACRDPRPAYFALALAGEALLPFASATEQPRVDGVRLLRFTFAPPKPDVWLVWDAAGDSRRRDLGAALGFATARVTTPPSAAGQTTGAVALEPTDALLVGPLPVLVERAE